MIIGNPTMTSGELSLHHQHPRLRLFPQFLHMSIGTQKWKTQFLPRPTATMTTGNQKKQTCPRLILTRGNKMRKNRTLRPQITMTATGGNLTRLPAALMHQKKLEKMTATTGMPHVCLISQFFQEFFGWMHLEFGIFLYLG